MICNTHVKDILKDQKKIILDDGKVINFDNLVLCTGSIVKKIDYPELESNILYLRDIKDSLKIRDIIKNNKKIAIIGAGYIGLEIASIIRKNKINTTIIELENNVGDKLVGLSGKEIFKIYPKMKDAQTWKRWYFYPIDVNIGCGPWHYV